jgi:glycosyltransferase involved in cell wall biosynthesis
MSDSDTIIIVPAFNEETSIVKCIRSLFMYGNVVVINDGSSDQTELLARREGAIVISHERNLGYELALRSGLEYAKSHRFTYAISYDADCQHYPESVGKVLENLRCSSDIVIGNRPRFQRLSEYCFALVTHLLWGIKDPLCGLKGYRIRVISGFQFDYKFNSVGTIYAIQAAKAGSAVNNIDIPIRSRQAQTESRFGTNISAEIRIFKALYYVLLGQKHP